MIIRLILIYLLNIFDVIATQRLINKYGLVAEANPGVFAPEIEPQD